MKTSFTTDKHGFVAELQDTRIDDYESNEADESKLRNADWARTAAQDLVNRAPDNSEVSVAIEVTDKGASVSAFWK